VAQAEPKTSRRHHPPQAGVPDLFEAQVKRRPGAVALEHGGQWLTYRQLDARANQLAHRLRELGTGPHTLCGVCLPRSFDMVVAVLGVLKAGAAYLPLDPSQPAERLDLILKDAQASALLTHERVARGLTSRLPGLDVTTVLLDSGAPLIACQPDVPPDRPPLAGDVAYLVPGSGSIEKPEGVLIEHRGVVDHLLALQRDYGLGDEDTVLQLPPLALHPSVRDILGTLCAGARLVLLEESSARDPLAVLRAMDEHDVTCLLSLVPALARGLLGEPGGGSLRLALTYGDGLGTADARGLEQRFGCQVVSKFDPTGSEMAASKAATRLKAS
jgi:non-ribosomal peptide synthetase component F